MCGIIFHWPKLYSCPPPAIPLPETDPLDNTLLSACGRIIRTRIRQRAETGISNTNCQALASGIRCLIAAGIKGASAGILPQAS
eukprot:1198973-Rhodomonas_salina.1